MTRTRRREGRGMIHSRGGLFRKGKVGGGDILYGNGATSSSVRNHNRKEVGMTTRGYRQVVGTTSRKIL